MNARKASSSVGPARQTLRNFRGLQNYASFSCPVFTRFCLDRGAVSIVLDQIRDTVHQLQVECESAVLSMRTVTEVTGSILSFKAIAFNIFMICARTKSSHPGKIFHSRVQHVLAWPPLIYRENRLKQFGEIDGRIIEW